MEEKHVRGNIVLFPFMAQGHLNPFIDLAHLLISRHAYLTLTIVSTPANVLNIRPLFSSNPSVRFAELPFHSSDHEGLPSNIEHTHTLSRPAISRLYHASQSLQPSFHNLISSILESNDPPLLSIVSDMFLAWSVDVSRAFNLFHTVLYTSGPYAMSIYNSIWTHLPHTLTSAIEFTLPDLPHITIHRSQLSKNMKNATGPDNTSVAFVRRQAECCRRSDGALWNTVAVLERQSLKDWERAYGKPVWPIGPLYRARRRRHLAGPPDEVPPPCIAWLDRHPPGSVVYVSFGSQNRIGRMQTAELAKGLEGSGRPFVWVIRPPIGSDDTEENSDLGLPDGFEDRIKKTDRGILIRRWGPQVEILEHAATGVFVSHCGWNSVLESLGCGVPLIGWPLGAEQFYNSKLLVEELGVCEEIARGEDEMIGEGDVVRVLNDVFDGERGREMRQRAEALRAEMQMAVDDDGEGMGSSIRALDEFVGAVYAKR